MKTLEGIRVVEVSTAAFVPSAGGVLAHWGADVIKVEHPRQPDDMRVWRGGTLEQGGAHWMFNHYNRGKRSVGLDLTKAEGRDVLFRLVEKADVFLTNFLSGTRKKLRFDIDDIRAVNPGIVYAKGTGHGPLGPDAERRGYDVASWWCRGSLAQTAMDVSGAHWPPGLIGHGDGMSGMVLAGGICAALLQRERTEIGAVVDGSLFATAVWFNGPAVILAGMGQKWAPAGAGIPREQRHPARNIYRTRDGRFILLSMLGSFDEQWEDLCDHLGRPELAADERFSTSAALEENAEEGVRLFDEIFASRTLKEWSEALAGIEAVWAPVQEPGEIIDDPQTVANSFVAELEYPTGVLQLPAPPVMFDEDAGRPAVAPDFCEHTEEILRQDLGYDSDRLQKLRAAGTVL